MVALTVLGIDLGLIWETTGSAIITFETAPNTEWSTVETGVIRWPEGDATPAAMAYAIDEFARARNVLAVSMDGPQGWRDPASSSEKVGRRCESECRTQGKTGVLGTSYPRTQLRWITFSIGVFDELSRRPHVRLVNDPARTQLDRLPAGQFYLLECFPTSTWRAAGLKALPAKAARPEIAGHYAQLQEGFGLPPCPVTNHDDLQAVVAALPAAALVGGPAEALPRGIAAVTCRAPDSSEHRVEGIIWDAKPRMPSRY